MVCKVFCYLGQYCFTFPSNGVFAFLLLCTNWLPNAKTVSISCNMYGLVHEMEIVFRCDSC